MLLTYEQEVVTREKKTRELRVPNEWGMYTSKGNGRLKVMAQKAYAAVEKVLQEHEYGVPDYKLRPILVKYIMEWLRLQYTKTYGECGDTAVRESVGDFHDKLYIAAGGSRFNASDAWNRRLEEAYDKRSKR